MESFPPVNTSIRSTIRTSSTDSTSSERIRRRRPCSGCAICFRSVRPFILQGIFLLLGIGLLIPWNAFISAKAYFESRICLEDGTFPPETTTSSSQISSFFALVFNLSSVISVTAMIAMESWKDYWITTTTATTTRTTSTLDANHDAQLVRSESATPRLTACLEIDPLNDSQTYPYGHALFNDSNNKTDNNSNTGGGNSFWLVTLPLSLYVFVFWSQSIMTLKVHTPSFLEWTTAGLVVCGMASGIAGAGIVASAGPFEARLAMNPFLTGQSIGGVVVSLANFVAASHGDNGSSFRRLHCNESPTFLEAAESPTCSPYKIVDWSMFLYFGLGSVALVACLVGFSCIERFRDVSDDYLVIFGGDDDSTSLGAVVTSGLELHCGVHDVHAREDSTTQDERKHSLSDPTFVDSTQQPEITLSGIDEDEDCSLENNIPSDRNNVDFFSSFRSHHEQRILESFSVWKQVQEPVICIFLTFFVTLSLFPGLTSALYSVRRCHSQYRIFNDLYVPFGFVLFNIGDLSGRLLFSRFSLTGVRNLSTKLVVASCLRCVFFPLLFICNGGNHIHGDSSWRVPSDLYSCLVQLSLAVSNGYLLSAAFALAPSLVPQDVRKQEHMSKLLSAAVAFGLFFGSLLSFPVSTLAGV